MSKPSADQGIAHVIRLISLLLSSNLPSQLGELWRVARKVFQLRAYEGMYEVLEYESLLDLTDKKGKQAIFHKRQRVRFNQNNIIAYQDQAMGDGELFADYQCSPGKAVDRYQEGHRYRILISLRESKKRGDIEEFRIQRTIRNGFRGDIEYFQTEIDHPTQELSLSVIFPKQRFPKQVALLEQNLRKTTPLGLQFMSTLPDGRRQVTWSTTKPRLFEAYIIKWEW